jgi:ABC-type Fe3+/spermidine/putrescine transport system ATPase subunit
MSNIVIENIDYAYQKTTVLSKINLNIPAGKTSVIVGPTGSGKTTLLRIISGLEAPDNGKIFIDNTLATNGREILLLPHERALGFVFQDLALWPHLSVYNNIAFGLEERRDKNTREKVCGILDQFGIADKATNYPHELSGGQKQLVAIARSLVLNPSILLLDEPLSNLDVKIESKITEILKSTQQRRPLTIVWVLHDHNVAFREGDFLIVLNGNVEEADNPSQILKSGNPFIKDFIKIPTR